MLVSVTAGCSGKEYEVYVDNKRVKSAPSLESVRKEYPYFVFEQEITRRQAAKLRNDGAECVCCSDELAEAYNFDADIISVFIQLDEKTFEADGIVCPECAQRATDEANR